MLQHEIVSIFVNCRNAKSLVAEVYGLRGKSFFSYFVTYIVALVLLANIRGTLCLITKDLGSRGKINLRDNNMNYRNTIVEYLNERKNHCVNPSMNRMLYGIYKTKNGNLPEEVKFHIKKLSKSKKRRLINQFAEIIKNKK